MKKMKTLLIISLTIFMRMNSIAQDSDGVSQHVKYQASSTFDPVWANRFQTVLDSVGLATGIKGASLAVLAPGQGLFTAVSGISSEGVPITRDMRFGIGSNTKAFVAVMLLKLQELGLLSLDDHLYQWLPKYPNVDSTITIRQMLSHQSGIFNFAEASNLMTQILDDTLRFWTPQEVLATIVDPYFSPGASYHYSNTNFSLGAMVIEAVTGKSWIQNLHDIIFDPLHMTSTFAGAYEPYNGPVAREWWYNIGEVKNSPMTSEYSYFHGSGAMLSTAQEMVEWYRALFNGEVISRESLLEFTDFESTTFCGLGIKKTIYKDHLTYCHKGQMMGYSSGVYYDTQTKATMCLLINDTYTAFDIRINPLLNTFINEYPKKTNDA
ncbi:MAG: serine hydrolase, partial [Bacteroidia bacterium]|nr:serine hydrolase [Bacteroidia bacterium]